MSFTHLINQIVFLKYLLCAHHVQGTGELLKDFKFLKFN